MPAELRDEGGRALVDFFVPRAAAAGEPWRTFLSPAETAGMLDGRGMDVIEDVGRREQVDASLWRRSDTLHPHELGRLVHAVVRA